MGQINQAICKNCDWNIQSKEITIKDISEKIQNTNFKLTNENLVVLNNRHISMSNKNITRRSFLMKTLTKKKFKRIMTIKKNENLKNEIDIDSSSDNDNDSKSLDNSLHNDDKKRNFIFSSKSLEDSDKHNEFVFISKDENNFIFNILLKIFPDYKEDEIYELERLLFLYKAEKDDVLYSIIDNTSCLFIVKSGKVGELKGEVLRETYMRGDVFGDFLLINKINKSIVYNSNDLNNNILTYKAIIPSEIIILSSADLNNIHLKYIQKKYEIYFNIIKKIPYIKHLDQDNLKYISEEIIEIEVNKGMILQLKKRIPDSFYYIVNGTLKYEEYYINSDDSIKSKELKKMGILNEGQFINEDIFIYNSNIKSFEQCFNKRKIIVESENAKILLINKENLKNFFGEEYYNIVLFNIFYNTIKYNSNNIIYRTINSFIKTNEFIQNNINEHYAIMEESVEKKKIQSPKKIPDQNEIIIKLDKMNNSQHASNNMSNINSICDISNFKNKSKNQKKRGLYISHNYLEFKEIFKLFSIKTFKSDEILNKTQYQVIIILKGSIIENVNKTNYIYQSNSESSLLYNLYETSNSESNHYKFLENSIILEGNLEFIYKDKNFSDEKITILNKFILSSIFLKSLSDQTLFNICMFIEKYEYSKKDLINCNNEELDSIYYLDNGEVKEMIKEELLMEQIKIKNNGGDSNSEYKTIVNYYSNKGLFGEEEFLKNSNKMKKYLYTAEKDNTIVFKIKYEVLNKLIGHNLISFIRNHIFNNTKISFPLNTSRLLAFIGKGTYGCVNLIKYNNTLYAVKSFEKKFILSKRKLIDYLKSEKDILTSIQSPFVLNLKFTVTDKECVHFIMEHVNGIDLTYLLNNKYIYKKSNECLFYFVNIIIILEQLRKDNIIHRDIKPANIMIQSNGYLKLIDFGLSKKAYDYTYTIIGSPLFIAPEIIKGHGYGRSCDYWSVGITIFYMFFNKYPFGNEKTSLMTLYNEILEKELSFPKSLSKLPSTDEGVMNIKSIITSLLEKKSINRPCSISKIEKIVKLPYTFNEIYNLLIGAPYIPCIDYSNTYNFYNVDDSLKIKENNYDNIKNCEGVEFDVKYIKNKFRIINDKEKKYIENDFLFSYFDK